MSIRTPATPLSNHRRRNNATIVPTTPTTSNILDNTTTNTSSIYSTPISKQSPRFTKTTTSTTTSIPTTTTTSIPPTNPLTINHEEEDDEDEEGFHTIAATATEWTATENSNTAATTTTTTPIQALTNELIGSTSFVPTVAMMKTHLSVFHNEQSSYPSVAKACLIFNQWSRWGSCNGSSDTSSSSSVLLHMQECTTVVSNAIRALLHACTCHVDRRCRILAIQTTATLANACISSKLTMSNLVFTNRNNLQCISKLQDEIINDVCGGLLVNCILQHNDHQHDQDAISKDDGISSIAMEALGTIVMNEPTDGLHQEIQTILHCSSTSTTHNQQQQQQQGIQGYQHVFASDVNYKALNYDFQWRVLESIVAPKARMIFTRVHLYTNPIHKARAMPFLIELMTFVYQTHSHTNHNKISFAKRWFELDSTNLVHEFVTLFLLPMLTTTIDCNLSTGTAVHALRLLSVVGSKECWVEHVNECIVRNLTHGMTATTTSSPDETIQLVVPLLIAIRGVSMVQRMEPLSIAIKALVTLPSTTCVPDDIVTSACFIKGRRRKPLRMGLWIEIALALLLPDERTCTCDDANTYLRDNNTTSSGVSTRANSLQEFLQQHESFYNKSMRASKTSTSDEKHTNLMDPCEEMVFSFCSVALLLGEWMILNLSNTNTDATTKNNDNGNDIGVGTLFLHGQGYSWMESAHVLLDSFVSCLHWEPFEQNENDSDEEGGNEILENATLENATSLCSMAQKSYISLLKLVLTVSKRLVPDYSIYYHLTPSTYISQQNAPSTQSNDANDNVPFQPTSTTTVCRLFNKIFEEWAKRKITFRNLRMSLLMLMTDAWISLCKLLISTTDGTQGDDTNNAQRIANVDEGVASMHERHVRELLGLLATEISCLIDGEKKRNKISIISNDDDDAGNTSFTPGEDVRCLMSAIACVESIAYAADQWGRHLKDSENDRKGVPKYIVSVCIVVLKGQGQIEVDEFDDDSISVGTESTGDSSSVPKSPRARARTTQFTSECAEAARRIRNTIRINKRLAETDGDTALSSIETALSPVCKLPNFSVPVGDDEVPYFPNVVWKLTEQLSTISFRNVSEERRRLSLNEINTNEPLFSLRRFFVGDEYYYGYLMQQNRQHICYRIEDAISSSPLEALYYRSISNWSTVDPFTPEQISRKRVTPRPVKPLRLSFPIRSCPSMNTDPGVNGIETTWENQVTAVTGGSDPLSVTLAYSIREYPRFDGEIEWRLVVTILLYNVTPVPIPNGVRLDLTISESETSNEDEDAFWSNFLNEISLDEDDIIEKPARMTSATSTFKHELEAGGHLIWEVSFDSWPPGEFNLCTSVTLREIEAEGFTHQWLCAPVGRACINESLESTIDYGDNQDREVAEAFDPVDQMVDEEDETMDTVLVGVPVPVPILICLKPCPFVYCGGRVDDYVFRFLWLSLPYRVPKISLIQDKGKLPPFNTKAGQVLASVSSLLLFDDCSDAKPLKAWAFSTSTGSRLFCLRSTVISSEEGSNVNQCTIFVRSDCMILLRSFLKTRSTRINFISNLLGNEWTIN